MLAQASAATTAPSNRTALLVSVRKNWRSGVCRWRIHAVRSVKPGRRVPFIAQPSGRTSRLLEQPGDGGSEASALCGQPVLGVGGAAGDELSLHDPRALQPVEALRKRCRRDAGKRLAK